MSSAQSSNTPQFKKKLLSEKSPSSTARESGSHIPKHQSFDYSKSQFNKSFSNYCHSNFHVKFQFALFDFGLDSPMVSLVRSGT